MGLKGSRLLQDRRALARRGAVAALEARRQQLLAGRPATLARAINRAWDAARDFDRGAGAPVATRFVEAVCGPPIDVADCICPGCATLVPTSWESGLCGPCINEECAHDGPARREA